MWSCHNIIIDYVNKHRRSSRPYVNMIHVGHDSVVIVIIANRFVISVVCSVLWDYLLVFDDFYIIIRNAKAYYMYQENETGFQMPPFLEF